jgi:hypothetical protein
MKTRDSVTAQWGRQISLGSSFRRLLETYQLQEKHLEEAKNKDRKSLDGLRTLADPYDSQTGVAIFVHEARHHDLFVSSYPVFLRYSAVINAALLLEYYLREVCSILEEQGTSRIVHRDLKGTVIDQVKAYLDKVLGLVQTSDDRWPPIHDLMAIRNALVHRNGFVLKDEEKALRQVVARWEGIEIERDRIMFSSAATEAIIDTCRGLVDYLAEKTGLAPSRETLISALQRNG